MVHVLASFGFSLVALSALSLIVATLVGSSGSILAALGFGQTSTAWLSQRPVRVSSAGRWQSVQVATDRSISTRRAA